MIRKPNVTEVVNQKMCNTCGACFAACTPGAISFRETVGGHFYPVVETKLCTHCGLCYEVCPGIRLCDTLKSRMPQNPFSGSSLGAFVGRSTDEEFYINSQSGGIVSSLLAYALEIGQIKGAVCVSMEFGAPPRPEIRIARNRQELFHAQKSKYCPVPLLTFLKNIYKEDIPVAVVGIPCQIHGLHNLFEKQPLLKNKIAFVIGLVCDRIMTYAGLDFLIDRSGIGKKTETVLHYRDKRLCGYPGEIHVFSRNGDSVMLSSSVRMSIKDFFTPARCRLCFDKMNIFSDITVGDPHGLEGVDRKGGESMLVVRTKTGQKIFQAAKADKAIEVRPVEFESIIEGQCINKKKNQWRGYVEAWLQLGRSLPDFCVSMKPHFLIPVKITPYLYNLQHSWALDEFPQRRDLLSHVQKILKRRMILHAVFYPGRLIHRWAGNFIVLVKRRCFQKSTQLDT